MVASAHNLILDYQEGTYQVRCSCGQWQTQPIPSRVQGLGQVYDRIEVEHEQHVEEVESQVQTLA